MTLSLERRVISEIIILYKELPCLWDNRQVLYSNKEARDQAYEVLLEKYKQFIEDATIIDLKKRIENMRTSYRREHKKVLLSRLNGGDEYVPLLWYYDKMTFLNEVMEFTNLRLQAHENGDDSMKIEFDDESSSSFKNLLEIPSPHGHVKRRKTSTYLKQQRDSDEDVANGDVDENEVQLNQDINHLNMHSVVNLNGVTETEAFGTTIGLQLKELDSMQKVYAEKLISDVIYHARLHRLTFNSHLNI